MIDRCFRRSVRSHERSRTSGFTRTHIQNHSTTRCRHVSRFGGSRQRRNNKVLINQFPPVLAIKRHEWPGRCFAIHADIVHGDIEFAVEATNRVINRSDKRVIVSGIGDHCERIAALSGNRANNFAGFLNTNVMNSDACTRSSQPSCDFRTNTGTRPGHNCIATGKVDLNTHWVIPVNSAIN